MKQRRKKKEEDKTDDEIQKKKQKIGSKQHYRKHIIFNAKFEKVTNNKKKRADARIFCKQKQ